MFTNRSNRRVGNLNGVCARYMVNGIGLGEDEYQGQSKTGQLLNTAAGFYNPLTTMLPMKSIPVIGKLDPLSMSLAVASGGLTLIPGVSKIIGGLFKKATHMGDCMKWWNNESNIRGMVSNISPYPVDVNQVFPEASYEYQSQHARNVMESSEVRSVLAESSRRYQIGTYYVSGVRSNPDLMQMLCMTQPKVQEETGQQISASQVDPLFEQLKEQARQKEYQDTVNSIGRILASYQRVVQRKVEVVQKTRERAVAFKAPEGVTSITKGGALVLTPGVSTNRVIDRGVIGKATEIRKK
jgi:hypothetical protein